MPVKDLQNLQDRESVAREIIREYIDKDVLSITGIATLVNRSQRHTYNCLDSRHKAFFDMAEISAIATLLSGKGYNKLSELFYSNRLVLVPMVPGLASGVMNDKAGRLRKIAEQLEVAYENRSVDDCKDILDNLPKVEADIRAEIGNLAMRLEGEDDEQPY